MPDDTPEGRNGVHADPLAGTGLEEFADWPGLEPPPPRRVLQGGTGYRELPPSPEHPDAELLRAMVRSLGAKPSNRLKRPLSRTD